MAKQCVNRHDGHGDTALNLSARNGHVECCRLLLEHGANPDAGNPKTTKHSPMHSAAQRDEREVLATLFEFDGDPTLRSVNGETARDLALRFGHLRTAEWLAWAEADYRRRHPPRASRSRLKFIDCECSFCAVTRSKNGNRDDPAVAPVGVARKSEGPGYTARHDQRANYLVWEAERRQLKHAEEPAP